MNPEIELNIRVMATRLSKIKDMELKKQYPQKMQRLVSNYKGLIGLIQIIVLSCDMLFIIGDLFLFFEKYFIKTRKFSADQKGTRI